MNITLNSVFKLAFQIFGYDFVFQLDDDDNNSQKRHFSLQKRLRCKLRNILHHRGSVFVAGTSLHLKEDKQKSNKLNAGNEKQDDTLLRMLALSPDWLQTHKFEILRTKTHLVPQPMNSVQDPHKRRKNSM